MFVFLGSWFVEIIRSRNGTFVIIFRGTFGRIGPFKKKKQKVLGKKEKKALLCFFNSPISQLPITTANAALIF